jgi:hypothetical protein
VRYSGVRCEFVLEDVSDHTSVRFKNNTHKIPQQPSLDNPRINVLIIMSSAIALLIIMSSVVATGWSCMCIHHCRSVAVHQAYVQQLELLMRCEGAAECAAAGVPLSPP